MYLAQLSITNFRKLKKTELHFRPGLNIIVGANNVGKTAIVDALRALLAGHDEPYPRFDISDLHCPKNGSPVGEISFHYVFKGLDADDEADFLPALKPDASGNLEAHITVRYSDADKAGRFRIKRWCSDHEDVGLTSDMAENLRSVYALTRNYRSVPAILTLANGLSSRTDTADRPAPETQHGAFFIGYKNAEQEQLVSAFRTATIAAELRLERSAVICRGREQVSKLTGSDTAIGQGTVKGFASAAIHRDKRQDYMSAFKAVAGCIASLLVDPPPRLVEMITQPARYPEARLLRREIWNFTRNPNTGLPTATLQADTQWHPFQEVGAS